MEIKYKDGVFVAEKVIEEPVEDNYVLEQYKAGLNKFDENKAKRLELELELEKLTEEQDKIGNVLEMLETGLKEKGLLQVPEEVEEPEQVEE